MRRPPVLSTFTLGAVLLVVTAALVALAFRKDVPFTNDGHRLDVVFTSVVNVRAGTPVRLAGVAVGKVRAVRLRPDGRTAVAELRLEERALPLHTDATARIRPRLFLEGNYFVELHPGTPGAPLLRDGATLADAGRNAGPVQLDQVLTVFQRDTRSAARAALAGLADVVEPATAQTIRSSLRHMGPALRDGSVVLQAARGGGGDLAAILADLRRVTGALNRDAAALPRLLRGLDTTTLAFDRRTAALDQSLERLPGTLDVAARAFVVLEAAARPTAELSRALARPITRLSRLRAAMSPWAASAIALLRRDGGIRIADDLLRLSADAATSVRAAAPASRDLRATVGCLDRVYLPTAKARVADGVRSAPGAVYREALSALVALNGATSSFDGNGSYARLASGGSDTIARTGRADSTGEVAIGRTAAPVLGSAPVWRGARGRPGFRPIASCVGVRPPVLTP